ncbi:MAG: Transcriptional regulator, GntR family [uncultured Thermomicrobiales bacterium]|uniref:Transcriptional regulator, GntR family n=1 Tax=uncultured Thermomicrobiales bacterium TaxID=1645740 RepID=A0A6J4ULF5_9BACT|nr:MAG: Transcriptional regulator, GntR family [uncultured Thermomicrobiales bacterium]
MAPDRSGSRSVRGTSRGKTQLDEHPVAPTDGVNLRLLESRQPHRTKQAMVYEALRGAIMRTELQPGQRLIIDDISRQLGVSQIPVREALQLLQSERLVTNVPHIGATVAPISLSDLTEVFLLMEGLEGVALEAVIARAPDRALDSLEVIVRRMDDAVANDDGNAWAELNSEFHRQIAAAANMPLLLDMTRRTLDQWDRIRRYFSILNKRLPRAQAQHHAILDALRSRDIDAVHRLSREHNREPLSAYVAEFELGSPTAVPPGPDGDRGTYT